MKKPAVYLMTNKLHGTIYTGVTSNLPQRIYQHKNELIKGFTSKYDCKLLVYYEQFLDMEHAILREKQLKGGSRLQKIKLIENMNPQWKDLYESLF
jgi:putative endonuclease